MHLGNGEPMPWYRRLDGSALLLVLLPLALLCANPNWIFNFPGWADQWIYFGNQQNLSRKLHLFGMSYRVTRFSWDLPGFLCYALLPPVAARLTLHLAFYYTALFSCYAIARRLWGSRAALLCSVLMGGYPMFLISMGWDYIDGACQTYVLLTLYCTLKAAEGPSHKLFLVLAGAFYLAGATAFPVVLLFGPVALGLYLLRRERARAGSLVAALGWGCIGVVALALTFCGIYKVATGKFFYIMTTVNFAGDFMQMKNVNPTPEGWWHTASWVVVPGVVVLAGLVVGIRQLWRRERLAASGRAALLVLWSLVAVFGAFCACEYVRLPFIRVAFYTSMLTPLVFLGLAGLFAPAVERLSATAFRSLMAVTVLCLAAPLWPSWRPALAPWITPTLIWSLAALLATLLLFFTCSRRPWLVPSCVLTISAVGAVDSFGFPWVFMERGYSACDIHCALAQSHQHLREVWPRQFYRFWYPADDPLTRNDVYYSLAISTSVGNVCCLNGKFPGREDFLDPSRSFVVEPGTGVVILGHETDVAARANASLKELGLTCSLVTERHVAAGKVAFTMTFLQVDKLQSQPEDHTTSSAHTQPAYTCLRPPSP
jgi:hypothetical protein